MNTDETQIRQELPHLCKSVFICGEISLSEGCLALKQGDAPKKELAPLDRLFGRADRVLQRPVFGPGSRATRHFPVA